MHVLFILCLLFAALLGGAFYAYRIAFYAPKKDRELVKPIADPAYSPIRDELTALYRVLRDRPCEFVTVTSHDGLLLSGRYYHVRDGAPLDIGFHGYRSHAMGDFSGGSEISFQLEHNLLLVDQRAHGKSQGNTISFGIKERYDVVTWVQYALQRFGTETQILLFGVSMGAATVLMAADLSLPNVKGIVADCPYVNAMDIICHVGKDNPVPTKLIKPFSLLGARIFGGFDLMETDALSAVSRTNIPILVIHGEADTLVPCEMSAKVPEVNPAYVRRHTFPGAIHAVSYMIDRDRYRKLVTEFFTDVLK